MQTRDSVEALIQSTDYTSRAERRTFYNDTRLNDQNASPSGYYNIRIVKNIYIEHPRPYLFVVTRHHQLLLATVWSMYQQFDGAQFRQAADMTTLGQCWDTVRLALGIGYWHSLRHC